MMNRPGTINLYLSVKTTYISIQALSFSYLKYMLHCSISKGLHVILDKNSFRSR